MKSRLLPAAKRELTDAANFYDEARPGLGVDFIGEFDKAVELILSHIRIGQVTVETRVGIFHEYVLPRFPYRLVYTVEQDGVLIIAVAHQHRQPLYWQRRVREARACYKVPRIAA